MSTAEQWAAVLGAEQAGFFLRFQRLGLEARCRPLQADEVEECRRMGGEKGLRYALYLSCDALRQAGEQLRLQGALAMSFDITRRLAYGDILAAGGAILEKSGAAGAQVSLLEEGPEGQRTLELSAGETPFWQKQPEEPGETAPEDDPEQTAPEEYGLRQLFPRQEEERGEDAVLELARVFARRLVSAAANQ